MLKLKIVVSLTLVSVSICSELVIPPTLKFGVATSSYQIEGAWNVSDKGRHIWDNFVRERRVDDGSTGDVACDSYHLWERDIDMMTELGVDFYRFSISWPRILPTGFTNKISEDGKRYYNQLIDGLLAKGIEPMITIYHWEMPQRLQDLGGWANPLISDWFADYARVVFTLFGDRVKTWVTINEPIAICEGSYSLGLLAPGLKSLQHIGTYLCNKHVLLSHAKAWRIYDKEFRSMYKGEISLSNNLFWYEEKSPEYAELAELARQINAGRYSHPIYSKEGGWPPSIEKIIAENSAKQGYHQSRLPAFTEEEKKLVRGTFDFYGVNFYTSRLVSPKEPELCFGFPLAGSDELGAEFTNDNSWPVACNGWLSVYHEGLRKKLIWLKQQYGEMKFLITENGFPTCPVDELALDDDERVDFYKENLKHVVKSITEDGVNIAAYTAWSLMDNFEWIDGYTTKFGLYAVNFTDPERTRMPRKSALFFTKLIKTRKLIYDENIKVELYWLYYFIGVLTNPEHEIYMIHFKFVILFHEI
ncbi:myrosinase 1-like isoform X2 [Plodia interpunctella]|uniref:myrosinase 1-like isoform X2 n=1 Tax=Plodia interpunctella TaxID=58824 RepID=UPI002367C572|nr:myrosinase 1-like isoform X2 [Plodia interpunctella]